MFDRKTPLAGLMIGLFALSATPALANHIDTANATMTCNGYSLYVSASALVPKQSYTISYTINVSPGSTGFPITGSIPFTAPSSGTFSYTVTGSFPALTGSFTFSGTATLEGFNTIDIQFSPTSLTCAPPPVCSAVVTISGSMEGNLPVHPGDTIKAGYDFTLPGSQTADTVSFSNVSVTLPVQCPNGTTDMLTIPMPNYTVTVPANESGGWFPSGDQSSPLVYQGSIVAPSNLCGGQTGYAPQGATFNASLAASTSNPVNVRFHYEDNSAGSWSGTNSYCH
jgi:hypothetical protein